MDDKRHSGVAVAELELAGMLGELSDTSNGGSMSTETTDVSARALQPGLEVSATRARQRERADDLGLLSG
jgi:hypothetical protein